MSVKKRVKAINRFIAGCKTDGIYDDLNAACIMAGWDGLAGALTPLKGAAPTNNGFIASDYDRGGIGITGDGTSYIDSNRADDADGDDDNHRAVYHSTGGDNEGLIGVRTDDGVTPFHGTHIFQSLADGLIARSRSTTFATHSVNDGTATTFSGISRASSSGYVFRSQGTSDSVSQNSDVSARGINVRVFGRGHDLVQNLFGGAIAFYSIGSATDLALLDARVSTLMADLRAIEEEDFDSDAITYIRAVEAADGAYLETDVKVAINKLVVGLKFDSLWDAIGSSCLLCGPRTLEGALVPLRGDAPTPNGFVSGDYSRTDGLRDPNGTSYLDSNYTTPASLKDDCHFGVYTDALPATQQMLAGANAGSGLAQQLYCTDTFADGLLNSGSTTRNSGAGHAGFHGCNRPNSTTQQVRAGGDTVTDSYASVGVPDLPVFLFARNLSGVASLTNDVNILFYSIGSSLDLAKLDTHISDYVTAIGNAV
jgi:hypothetical protein